jgi:hypothetical protein
MSFVRGNRGPTKRLLLILEAMEGASVLFGFHTGAL